jgi:hypothetical protein
MLKVNLSRKDVERIMSKIVVDPVSDCWVWNGAIANGYGQTWYGDRMEYTHRVLFAWLVVPLPKGLGHQTPVLDHVVCDNRLCSNPFHLKLTTNRMNVLRGNSPVAVNARKSLCSKGHPRPDSRICSKCRIENQRKWRKKNRDRCREYGRRHRAKR